VKWLEVGFGGGNLEHAGSFGFSAWAAFGLFLDIRLLVAGFGQYCRKLLIGFQTRLISCLLVLKNLDDGRHNSTPGP
jgi:hypothetical protein